MAGHKSAECPLERRLIELVGPLHDFQQRVAKRRGIAAIDRKQQPPQRASAGRDGDDRFRVSSADRWTRASDVPLVLSHRGGSKAVVLRWCAGPGAGGPPGSRSCQATGVAPYPQDGRPGRLSPIVSAPASATLPYRSRARVLRNRSARVCGAHHGRRARRASAPCVHAAGICASNARRAIRAAKSRQLT
jgi:hypothetical protein